jgi:hypothetical protein
MLFTLGIRDVATLCPTSINGAALIQVLSLDNYETSYNLITAAFEIYPEYQVVGVAADQTGAIAQSLKGEA